MLICPACKRTVEDNATYCVKCHQKLTPYSQLLTYEEKESLVLPQVPSFCETPELVELSIFVRNLIIEDKNAGFSTLEKYHNNEKTNFKTKKSYDDTIKAQLCIPNFCNGKFASGYSIEETRQNIKDILPSNQYDKYTLDVLSFVLKYRSNSYFTHNRVAIIETVLSAFQLLFYFLKNSNTSNSNFIKRSLDKLGYSLEYLFNFDSNMFDWLYILRKQDDYENSNYVSELLTDFISNFKKQYVYKTLSFKKMGCCDLYDYEKEEFNNQLLRFMNEFFIFLASKNLSLKTETVAIENNEIIVLTNEHFDNKAKSNKSEDSKQQKKIVQNPKVIECEICHHINPCFYNTCQKCKEPLVRKNGLNYSETLSFLEYELSTKEEKILYNESQLEQLNNQIIKKQEENESLKNNYYKYLDSSRKYKKRQIFIVIFGILLLISLIVNCFYVCNTSESQSKVLHQETTTFCIDGYSQLVSAGEQAYVAIYGKPNTEYDIRVDYSSGPSYANGLGIKESNEKGLVEWSWKVGNNTNSGKYPIQISDGNNTIILYFQVD